MPTQQEPELCAHEACSCPVTEREAIVAEGQRYCSQGCAEGTGCEHEACNCSDGERSP